jgi:hypothetical protein
MDKRELVEVLQKLDEHLSSTFDVAIIGGAAMILVSQFRSDWAQRIKYFLEEQGWQIV